LLTGNTGSLRYMAPEVARNEPYNMTADSYSFGILFWQICSLTTPYVGLNQETHALHVVEGGKRPKIEKSWPNSWTSLMSSAWHTCGAQRPSMNEIMQQLRVSIEDMCIEDNVIPSRTSEIRAKKKRKKVSRENRILDIDSRNIDAAATDVGLRAKRSTSEII
jgi:serine/threonine protein kinase